MALFSCKIRTLLMSCVLAGCTTAKAGLANPNGEDDDGGTLPPGQTPSLPEDMPDDPIDGLPTGEFELLSPSPALVYKPPFTVVGKISGEATVDDYVLALVDRSESNAYAVVEAVATDCPVEVSGTCIAFTIAAYELPVEKPIHGYANVLIGATASQATASWFLTLAPDANSECTPSISGPAEGCTEGQCIEALSDLDTAAAEGVCVPVGAGVCEMIGDIYAVCGRFQDFFSTYEGLQSFGYPVSVPAYETIDGQERLVQWFQRHRLKLDSDDIDIDTDTLGERSVEIIYAKPWDMITDPVAFVPTTQGSCHNPAAFVEATAHCIDAQFWTTFNSAGADTTLLFGNPISEAFETTIAEAMGMDGSENILVQYFERARFELHYDPEDEPDPTVLFGLLGCVVIQNNGERVAFPGC